MADEYREQLTPGGQPPERAIELAKRDAALLADAVAGVSRIELQEKYNLSDRQVKRIMQDAARQVREDAVELVAEMFMLQHRRIERLYSLVEMELAAYEKYIKVVREANGFPGATVLPVKFDDRPFRVAVSLFERQAKLLGLDKVRESGATGGWIDSAPIDQVVDYARQLKMKIPTEFET